MTIAVLSWGAPKTLTQTLQSYNKFGLDSLDDERIIYFQQISGEDIEIAKRFGWKWIGSTDNVGIAEGYKALLEEATGEFFLFLENDWRLIEDPIPILEARDILNTGHIDLFRFRHSSYPGNPLWTRQFEGHEMEHPTHLLDSIHWTDPSTFEPIYKYEWMITAYPWFWTTSKYANWTNNPHMAYTKFLRDNIISHLGSRDLEIDIQGWWEQQDFRVAQGNGLFTHDRID